MNLTQLSTADVKAIKDQAESMWDVYIDKDCWCDKCTDKHDYWMGVFEDCALELEDRIENIFGDIPFRDEEDQDFSEGNIEEDDSYLQRASRQN